MASIPFNEIPLINPASLVGPETFPIESGGITFRTSLKDILSISQSIPGTSIKSLTIDATHLKPNSVNTTNIVAGSINTSHIQGRSITGPLVALKTLSAEHIVPDASFVLDKAITANKLSGVSKVRPGGLDQRNGFPESGTSVLSAITQNSAPVFGTRAWGMLEFTNPTNADTLKYAVSIKSGGNVSKVLTTGWTTPSTGGWNVVKVTFEVPMPTEYYAVNITSGPFVDGDHTYQVLFQDKAAFYFTSWDPGAKNSYLQKVDVGGYPVGLYEGAHTPYYYSKGVGSVAVPIATWTEATNQTTQGWQQQEEPWYTADNIKSVYGSFNNMDLAGGVGTTARRVTRANSSIVYFTVVC
jgi:hypothetical protein